MKITINRKAWVWIGSATFVGIILALILASVVRRREDRPRLTDPADLLLEGDDDSDLIPQTREQPILPADAGGGQDPPPFTGGRVETVDEIPWYRKFQLSNGQVMVLPDIIAPLQDPPPGNPLVPWENVARNVSTRALLDRGPAPYEGVPSAMRALYEGNTMPKVRYISIPYEINWQDAFNWGRPGASLPPSPVGLGTGWTERMVHILYAEQFMRGILGQYRLDMNVVNDPGPWATAREVAGIGAGMSFSPDYRAWYYGDYYSTGLYALSDVQRIELGWGSLHFGPRQAARNGWTPAPPDVRIQVGETDFIDNGVRMADYVIHWNLDDRYRYGLPIINADGYKDVSRQDQGWLEVFGIYETCIKPWSMAFLNPQQSTIILLRQLSTAFNRVWGSHIYGWLQNYKPLPQAWREVGLPTWGILERDWSLEHEAELEAIGGRR